MSTAPKSCKACPSARNEPFLSTSARWKRIALCSKKPGPVDASFGRWARITNRGHVLSLGYALLIRQPCDESCSKREFYYKVVSRPVDIHIHIGIAELTLHSRPRHGLRRLLSFPNCLHGTISSDLKLQSFVDWTAQATGGSAGKVPRADRNGTRVIPPQIYRKRTRLGTNYFRARSVVALTPK